MGLSRNVNKKKSQKLILSIGLLRSPATQPGHLEKDLTFPPLPVIYTSMNKLFKVLTLASTLSATALGSDLGNLSASVGVDYNTSYLVNNVSQAENAATAGLKLGVNHFGIDLYARGLFLADTSQDTGYRYGGGLGKSFGLTDGLSLKVDGTVDRAQTGQTNVLDYTEANILLSLRNAFLIPYVKGAYQIELDQYGYTVGLEKPFELFNFVTVNPAVEYTKMTDYEAYAAKITLTKVIWKNLSVFAQGAYIDNNFSTKAVNFATKELNGSLVGSGGLRWVF